ncbi:MAG: hypothetical protein GY853_14145 [PVC group bacterium]|nr:hypothetical protein [PVC group bacterium]
MKDDMKKTTGVCDSCGDKECIECGSKLHIIEISFYNDEEDNACLCRRCLRSALEMLK